MAGKKKPAVSASASMELGRDIYNYRCYFCHGYSGNAKTLAGSFLKPAPLDFTSLSPDQLSKQQMISAVTHGKPGTAMQSFAQLLSNEEVEAVIDFVRHSFMHKKQTNTRYHTVANGWENHEQYRAAYPFALGQIALDTPWNELTPEQQQGKRLYMSSCISCHDRARINEQDEIWQSRPLSFPRAGYSHQNQIDTISGASVYQLHEQIMDIDGLTGAEKRGQEIFQNNCAFCHAQDGTGKNWIGSYLEPHPRNLNDKQYFQDYSREKLKTVIANGVNGSAMPAWKTVLSDQQLDDVVAFLLKVFL